MNREHLHPESARGLNGSRDGVGDVVELQIEPDLCAGGQNRAHNFRAFGRVKLEPDFEKEISPRSCSTSSSAFSFVATSSATMILSAAFVMSSEVEKSQSCDHEQEIPRLRSE